jgi:hypothetical protein
MDRPKRMTGSELLEWGRAEMVYRKTDLTGIATPEDLERAQDRAKDRRCRVGLTSSEAACAVRLAQEASR